MASKSGKSASRRDGRRGKAAEAPGLASEGVWDRLPDRTRHLTILGILLVVSAVFFAPSTFEGKKLVGSDTLQSRAMAKSMRDYHDETGDTALWATNLFSGMPGYLISYPKVVIQVDSITMWAGRHVWPAVHFLLFLAGVYVLVISLTGNPLAALIAALGAALTTNIPIILSVGHTSKFAAIAWIPWLLTAFRYALRRPGWIAAGLFAVLLAAELRAGHPQISYQAAWLFGVWWIVEAGSAIRDGRLKEFAGATALLALGTILALLMVAQPYMAQYEYKQFSTRGGSGAGDGGAGLGWDYAMQWSQGKAELLTLFIANFLGGGSGLYWGDKPFTVGPHYLGGVIVLLAAIGVAGRRDRTVWGLSLGALVLTLFSLGKNAAWINHPLFDYFPLFSAFRAPEMWLHMVELSLAVLAGLGAAYVVGRDFDHGRRKKVLLTTGCVLGFSLLLTLGGESLFSFERPGERAQATQQLAARQNVSPSDPGVQQGVNRYLSEARSRRIDLFKSDAARTTIILLIAGVLLWLYLSAKLRNWALLASLAALVLIDLWGVDKRYLTDDSYVEGGINAQIPSFGFDRFIMDKVEESGGPGHFRTLSLERSPVNWARPAFFYETSGGYNAAKLQVYQDFIDNVLFDPGTGLPTQLGLDLSGTRYVIYNHPLPGMRNVFSDPSGFAVWERTDARSRDAFVGRYRVVETSDETYEALSEPGFDPKREAILREDPGLEPAPIDSTSMVNVSLSTYGPHEIRWEVETDRPRLFVTSEVYYPAGWRAFVDDLEVPILQTNHTFRSLAVPAGRHGVRMVFDPPVHRLSVGISTIATLLVYGGLMLFLGFGWIRRRRS